MSPATAPASAAPEPGDETAQPAPAPAPVPAGRVAPSPRGPTPVLPTVVGPSEAALAACASGRRGCPGGHARCRASDGGRRDDRDRRATPVKINEAGFDAAGVVWVELYNAGAAAVALEGWSLAGPGGAVVLPAVTIAPHAFVVGSVAGGLEQQGIAIEGTVSFITEAAWGAAMRREGGWIELAGPAGQPADALSWGTDATALMPAPNAVAAGHSLERMPAGLDRDLGEDFVENAAPSPGRGLAASTTVGRDWEEFAEWSAISLVPLAGIGALLALQRRRTTHGGGAAGAATPWRH